MYMDIYTMDLIQMIRKRNYEIRRKMKGARNNHSKWGQLIEMISGTS